MNFFLEFLNSSQIDYKINYDLSKASSFKIGGLADVALFPNNENELLLVTNELKDKNIKFDVIGNASNVLFSDEGYRGALIFTKNMDSLSCDGNKIFASCGAKLAAAAILARNTSLAGLEFAHGIPGSVGGAVVMNAGAFGGEIKDSIVSSRALDLNSNEIITLDIENHNFGYRKSIYTENKNLICISVEFELKKDNINLINDRMRQNSSTRRKKQPLEFPNSGSFFKRPDGFFAGKLIEDCSLKGFSVGGAQVSTKHAGFIINTGNATAKDVMELSDIIEHKVFEKFGVKLEREVKYIF